MSLAANFPPNKKSHPNRPFPSSKKSHSQSEAKCEAIDMKMIFNYDANKTHFHNKGFALSLVLKVRFFGTRKWPIRLQNSLSFSCEHPNKSLGARAKVEYRHAVRLVHFAQKSPANTLHLEKLILRKKGLFCSLHPNISPSKKAC